jgi:hypothetical protein
MTFSTSQYIERKAHNLKTGAISGAHSSEMPDVCPRLTNWPPRDVLDPPFDPPARPFSGAFVVSRERLEFRL